MHGFEAEGAAAIVQGKPIDNPETIATAIRIGNPASWGLAEAARDESGGYIHSVTDDEIVNAYKNCSTRWCLYRAGFCRFISWCHSTCSKWNN